MSDTHTTYIAVAKVDFRLSLDFLLLAILMEIIHEKSIATVH